MVRNSLAQVPAVEASLVASLSLGYPKLVPRHQVASAAVVGQAGSQARTRSQNQAVEFDRVCEVRHRIPQVPKWEQCLNAVEPASGSHSSLGSLGQRDGTQTVSVAEALQHPAGTTGSERVTWPPVHRRETEPEAPVVAPKLQGPRVDQLHL